MSEEWLTRAERSAFQETSRYAEAIEYCERLQQASPWIRYTTFGKSPEGRDLPLLIVSRHGFFTPDQASRSNHEVVLILNGIHPGEIAGKEATFMLIRDIAISKEKASLLDHVILLVIPIYNVDGHERFGPYNRINQNGPKEMGWRTTSQNLNLNRDWVKAEQPETRALLRAFATWLPDLVIDNHVSDGADFQYDVTWLADDHLAVAGPVFEYFSKDLEPYLLSSLTEAGHVASRYFEPIDPTDPAKGITIGPLSARYCNGYCTLQNRPALTVETHMLKSFGIRIRAHHDLMEAVLRKLNAEPGVLRNAVRKSDQETMALGTKSETDYPVRLKLNLEKAEPFLFRGVEFERQRSPISGSTRITYGSRPVDFTIPFFRTVEPEIAVTPPLGYAIPLQWTFVIERLEAHAIEFQRLKKPVTAEFETYRFSEVNWDALPFEGHHCAHYKTMKVKEQRTLPADSVIVWLNQRSNKVILELLEPDAADSLVAWGYFNAIFEDKEYAETYILEKLAEKMLQKDPELKEQFEALIARDFAFAENPAARLNFFYERSPYRDRCKNVYPIVRITSPSQVTAD